MAKVAALTLMKNEADILPNKLKYMEDQVDYYLFLDNESDDNSVEIVSKHPKTVFCDIVKGTFKTTMRDILIREAQKYIKEEDWIVLIDCDEVPFFNIKNQIMNIDTKYNCIRVYFLYFFFTKEMYSRWSRDEVYRKNISNFTIKNYLYFAPTKFSDIRGVKNIKINEERLLLTKLKLSLPLPKPTIIYDNDLYFGHYQYRNPEQIRTRLETRKKAIEMGSPSFHFYTKKWGLKDWNYKKVFVSEKKLIRYDYDKPFSMKGLKLQKMNKLFYKLFNPRKFFIYFFKYFLKK